MTRRLPTVSAVLAAAVLAGTLPASAAVAKEHGSNGAKAEKAKAKATHASATGRKNR